MTKRIGASGQSNAMGRGPGGPFPISDRVTVWNNRNERGDLSFLGNAFITPARGQYPFTTTGHNNFPYHACRYLAELLDEDVELILSGRGTQPISEWLPGNTQYERLLEAWTRAGEVKFDAFMWLQGERDNNIGTSGAYAAAFMNFLDDMEDDGMIDATTPIIIGETAVKNVAINPVLKSLVGGRIYMARTFPFNTLSDNVHFDGGALPRIGWEYAKILHNVLSTPYQPLSRNYVSAGGSITQALKSHSNTKIPLEAYSGKLSLFQDGGFVAPVGGLYRFTAKAAIPSGNMRLKLLDETGEELAIVAYGGNLDDPFNNPTFAGSADLDLGPGDVVFLGISHTRRSSTTLSANVAAKHVRMSVELIEEYTI